LPRKKRRSLGEKIYEILNNKELLNSVSENALKKVYRSWRGVAAEVEKEYYRIIEDYKEKHSK
jgi:glycosyltransferase involved in cell wall biosynthesis